MKKKGVLNKENLKYLVEAVAEYAFNKDLLVLSEKLLTGFHNKLSKLFPANKR